jgi:signal transduction histidine kinase
VLPYVFDLFDQGTAASSSGGLGLGLGLCKHIVEMHGGTISAAANPRGKGSSFVVQLPRRGPLAGPATPSSIAEHQ